MNESEIESLIEELKAPRGTDLSQEDFDRVNEAISALREQMRALDTDSVSIKNLKKLFIDLNVVQGKSIDVAREEADTIIAKTNLNEQLKQSLIAVKAAVESSSDQYRKNNEAMAKALEGASSWEIKNHSLYRSTSDLRKGLEGANKIWNKLSETEKQNSTQMRDCIDRMESLIRRKRADAKASLESRIQLERFNKVTETFSEKLRNVNDQAYKMGGSLNKSITYFGGVGLSVSKSKDSLISYSAQMFNLQRTFQSAGLSTSGLSNSFEMIKKSTNMSREEFASLSNDVTRMTVGFTPASDAAANLAMVIKDRFVVEGEKAKEVAQDLLNTFKEFPAAAQMMLDATELISKQETGSLNKSEEKRLELQRQSLMMLSKNKEERLKINQMFSKRTDEQKEQIGYTEKEAKLSQTTKDVVLKIGEELKGVFGVMTSSINGILSTAEKLDRTMSTVAFGMASMSFGNAFAGSGMLGMKGVKNAVDLYSLSDKGKDFKGSRGAPVVSTLSPALGPGRAPVVSTLSPALGPGRVPGGSTLSPALGPGRVPGNTDLEASTAINERAKEKNFLKYRRGAEDIDILTKSIKSKKIFCDSIIVRRGILNDKEKTSKRVPARTTLSARVGPGKGAKKATKIEPAMGPTPPSEKDRRKVPDPTSLKPSRFKGDRVPEESKIEPFKGPEQDVEETKKTNSLLNKYGAEIAVGVMSVGNNIMKFAKEKEAYGSGVAAARAGTRTGVDALMIGLGSVIGKRTGLGSVAGMTMAMQFSEMISGFINEKIFGKKVSENKGESPNEIDSANSKLMKMYDHWERIVANQKISLEVLKKQQEAYSSQADILNDIFVLSAKQSQEAYKKALDSTKSVMGTLRYGIDQLENSFREIFNSIAESIDLSELGIDDIDLNINASGDELVKQVDKIINSISSEISDLEQDGIKLQLKISAGDESEITKNNLKEVEGRRDLLYALQKNLTDRRNLIEEKTTDYMQQQKKLADQISQITFKQMQQQLTMNDSIEARVTAERNVMEAANFGMGASVKMMQKQVDLEFERITTIQKRLSQQESILFTEMKQLGVSEKLSEAETNNLALIAKQAFQEMKLAKGGEERYNISERTQKTIDETFNGTIDAVTAQGILNKAVQDYDKYQVDSLNSQKKIYDLTKDIREGYLDAMRHMSVGLGEFKKTVGTQDYAVTQLMRHVKKVTGQDRLNTMALGGLVDFGTKAYNQRQSPFGYFGIDGLNVTGGTNEGIYDYQKFVEEAQRLARGEGKKPNQGFVQSVDSHNKTVEASRIETMRNTNSTEANTNAIENLTRDIHHAINQDVMKGNAPGKTGYNIQDAHRDAKERLDLKKGSSGEPLQAPPPTASPPLPVPPTVEEMKKSIQKQTEKMTNPGSIYTHDIYLEKLAKSNLSMMTNVYNELKTHRTTPLSGLRTAPLGVMYAKGQTAPSGEGEANGPSVKIMQQQAYPLYQYLNEGTSGAGAYASNRTVNYAFDRFVKPIFKRPPPPEVKPASVAKTEVKTAPMKRTPSGRLRIDNFIEPSLLNAFLQQQERKRNDMYIRRDSSGSFRNFQTGQFVSNATGMAAEKRRLDDFRARDEKIKANALRKASAELYAKEEKAAKARALSWRAKKAKEKAARDARAARAARTARLAPVISPGSALFAGGIEGYMDYSKTQKDLSSVESQSGILGQGENIKDIARAKGARKAGSVISHSVAGAAIGAKIGTILLPGIGTTVGSIGGGIAGAFYGSASAFSDEEKSNYGLDEDFLSKQEEVQRKIMNLRARRKYSESERNLRKKALHQQIPQGYYRTREDLTRRKKAWQLLDGAKRESTMYAEMRKSLEKTREEKEKVKEGYVGAGDKKEEHYSILDKNLLGILSKTKGDGEKDKYDIVEEYIKKDTKDNTQKYLLASLGHIKEEEKIKKKLKNMKVAEAIADEAIKQERIKSDFSGTDIQKQNYYGSVDKIFRELMTQYRGDTDKVGKIISKKYSGSDREYFESKLMESKIESLNFSELTELDKKNDEIKRLEEVKEDWFKTDQEIEGIKKQIEKLKSQANDIGKREIGRGAAQPFSTFRKVTPKPPELSSNQIDQSGQAQRIKIDLFLEADAQLVANLRDAHNINVELTTVANTV